MENKIIEALNGALLRKMYTYGFALLDKNKSSIDALNVFPVPDGDTGINMSLTMKSVCKELDLNTSNEISSVCESISRGALKGARGNSGVILSQILKGIMLELAANKTGAITTKIFANAMGKGAEIAYKAVTVPKEGTMLTVIRVMADESKKIAKKTNDFVAFMTEVLQIGEEILAKTPELLPVLKKAGVVDAGGRGILVLFTAFLAVLEGKEDIEISFEKDTTKETASVSLSDNANLADLGEIEFAYCTEFMITQMYKTTTMSSIDTLREKLQRMGDSVICVGDLNLVKVHVHTNTPGEAITNALQLGEMINLKVDNMLEQNRELRAHMKVNEKEQGIVAVAAGAGIINVFRDLGVDFVIKGGQTMNPSAEDIAEAIRRVHAKTVFVFPNNKNITLAARHAQALTEKNIVVIPTKSINEGISACIVFNPDATIEENTEQFLAAADMVKSGSVTYASRTTKMDRFDIKQGEIIGLNDKNILAKGKTPAEVVVKLIEKMHDNDVSNITLFYGEEVSEKDASAVQDKLSQKYTNCEINVIAGNQPVYYYLVSLE